MRPGQRVERLRVTICLSHHPLQTHKRMFIPSGGVIYLSGIDMIHGTPVLDIKPYIADYDSPQNLSEQNDHHRPRAVAGSDGTANNCDLPLLSACGKAQPCRSTKETLKCPADGTSEENPQESRDMSEIQHTLPEGRERVVGLALEPSRGESMDVPEDQLGPQQLKSFLEEGTDRPRKVEGALVVRESSADTQWDASCHARTADRAACSVVPCWVKEAPVAPLQVRFTPHAEMDLRRLSSRGEFGSLGLLGGRDELMVLVVFLLCWGAGPVHVSYRPSQMVNLSL